MRAVVAVAVACLSVVSLSHADDARASIKKELSIPAQELVPALQALSREAEIHLVYLAEDVRGRRTAGAAGTLSINEALQKILSGTGLTFRYIDEQTISILPVAASGEDSSGAKAVARPRTTSAAQRLEGAAISSGSDPEVSLWERFRLAQAQDAKTAGNQSADGSGNASDAKPPVEEIVVTAQKREERLQDVPISISVMRGEALDRSTDRGVTEALTKIPGVAVTDYVQTGTPAISIRGVAASVPILNGSSPIAYYLDSVPFGFVKTGLAPDASAYDLERVEVLRGPQGTLYGASAQNGVVRVLTRDPGLSELEFKTRVSGSSTQYGGENYRLDSAFNMPIVEDKFAARVVVGYQDLSGWLDKPNDPDVNDADLANVRVKLKGQPTDKLSVGLSTWFSRSDFGAPSTGTDDRRQSSPVDESIDQDYDSYGLTFGYDFPAFSLTSSTSYLEYVVRSRGDVSMTGVNVVTTDLDADVFAQEINLSSSGDSAWQWSLGGIYRDAEDLALQVRRNVIAGNVICCGYQAPNLQRNLSTSFAVYGELRRQFGQFELTGGLRYFEDEVSIRELSRLTAPGGVPPAGLVNSDRKFDKLSPRLVLMWNPSPRVTAYASYAEGFRSGSDQNPQIIALLPTLPAVDPDNLKNYEVGTKGSFLDGRVAFDAAVYYEEWQKVQTALGIEIGSGAPGTNPLLPATLNSESASGLGFDLGLTLQPTDALTLNLAYGINDLAQDADVRAGTVVVWPEGDRLNLSPRYTLGGTLDYEFAIGAAGFKGRFSASANHTSERDQRVLAGTAVLIGRGDPITMAATRLSLVSPRRWTVTAFVDNVNNEQDSVLDHFIGLPEWAARVRPKTYGLQVDYTF